jgi:hypothetical protein
LIWFGYIARLSGEEGGDILVTVNGFYLPSLHIKEGGGLRVGTLWPTRFPLFCSGSTEIVSFRIQQKLFMTDN